MTIPLTTLKEILIEGKCQDLVVLPTAKQSGGLFTHIIITTASSARHAMALANRVLKAQKSAGKKKSNIEASEEREWVLIDCDDVIVHIMQQEARERYRLENLWAFEDRSN